MAKTIVITGAGSGLGRQIARDLAADGHVLILLGRTLAKLDKVVAEIGNGAFALACDVGDPASVRSTFAEIAARAGRVDALINNAAVYQPFLVKEATDAQIISAVQTNYVGPIYCARSAIALMGRGGLIINVSSESVELPFPMFALYQSSKAGLERFSEALGHELAPDGIRVTSVRAGAMMGEDMTWDITPEVAAKFGAACMKAGLDLRARPVSHFTSAAAIFRQLLSLPDDLHIPHVNLQARHR